MKTSFSRHNGKWVGHGSSFVAVVPASRYTATANAPFESSRTWRASDLKGLTAYAESLLNRSVERTPGRKAFWAAEMARIKAALFIAAK
jgi:hypothetical protein